MELTSNRNKEKFIIYNQQAHGVTTDSVKTAIGDIAILANNAYDLTNPLNTAVYADKITGSFYEKKRKKVNFNRNKCEKQ